MVNDIDYNISCTMSKYFWRALSNGDINLNNYEFEVDILFFESLPDNFYDLIEESGANRGKVKSNLTGISGCRPLINGGNPFSKKVYCYPIFRSEAGEDGFYIVMYDKDDGVNINDDTAYTDIATLCKNIILSFNDSDEHTINGFLIKMHNNDYLLAYCHMSNPIKVINNVVFTRNTKIINVGVCQESIGGF